MMGGVSAVPDPATRASKDILVTTLSGVESVDTTARRPSFVFSEDWLAVAIGFIAIALTLVGVKTALPTFAWRTGSDLAGTVLSPQNVATALLFGALVGVLSTVGILLMKGSPARLLAGFPVLYVVAWVALMAAGNAAVVSWGFEYVIFAFAFGLIISNVVGVPAWLKEAAQTEFYIKTGLVLLGASIVFGEMMQAGLLGLVQALLVVTIVWFFSFWLARRLRVDDEFATMLSSAVSICGVSAAIATCGAIHGDRKKLSYITSLVLIVAAPMMVVMPLIIRAFGIPDVVGGAWLGGTLDTSASVVAAGEMISIPARNAGVVVKLSQNVLIGVAAFFLTIWWALRNQDRAERPGIGIIWDRFPKFVLGFIVASFVFSFALDAAVVNQTKGFLTGLRTMWFALAFASIGLETRFSELMTAENGRVAVAFLGAQAFNVVWTLILAYLLFGGVFAAAPTFQ
jgi:uncharacterized membrane protein YadS